MSLRISAVSYLNTAPFIYGIEHSGLLSEADLSRDIPAECARKLLDGEVDIGLVPVAVIPLLESPHILTDFCIGCVGPVQTVNLYSEVPLEEIEQVYLDYQSRTSVQLVQVLARYHWNISPRWIDASEGFESRISGHNAAVVIGDRAFELNGQHGYTFDLGEAWQEFTGLPFVFACWVANKELPADVLSAFNKAVAFGMQHKAQVIAEEAARAGKNIDVKAYLDGSISYELDEAKRSGLDRFLQLLEQVRPVRS